MNRVQIAGGDETVVAAGDYQPASYSDLRGVTLRAGVPGKVRVVGNSDLGDRSVFRVNDGCDLTVEDLEFTASWRGIWATASKIALRRCHFHHNREIGCMLGGCDPAIVEDCVSEFNGKSFNPHSYCEPEHLEESADHGYYFSYGAQNSVLRRSIARDCTGCGLHSNRNDEDGIFCANLQVEDCQFIRCGSEGTAAIQLDATVGVTLRNVLVADCNAGVCLFDDGDGAHWACRNIVFERLTLYNPQGQFNFHFSPGTKGVSIIQSVLVLANAPMFAGTDDGEGEDASVQQTVIYCHNANHVPASIRANPTNSLRAIEDVVRLFPGAPQGNYTPADPNMTFGWRPLSPANPN